MDPLVERLTPIAERVRLKAGRLASVEERYLQQQALPHVAANHALVAAFEGFVACGGLVDQPEAFDWNNPEFEREVVRRFADTYTGKHSILGDAKRRNAFRRQRLPSDRGWWRAWGVQVPGSTTTWGRQGKFPVRMSVTTSWDDDVGSGARMASESAEATQLNDLLERIRQQLSPRDFYWFVARHVYHVGQHQLIDELVARDARYQDAQGRRRAEQVINTAISRARRKLRQTLVCD